MVRSSPDLFRQLWPKLVRASSVEAIAEGKGGKYAEATAEDVRKCMAEAEKGQAKEKAISERTKMRVNDAPAAAKFETRDEQEGDWVHQNYINK